MVFLLFFFVSAWISPREALLSSATRPEDAPKLLLSALQKLEAVLSRRASELHVAQKELLELKANRDVELRAQAELSKLGAPWREKALVSGHFRASSLHFSEFFPLKRGVLQAIRGGFRPFPLIFYVFFLLKALLRWRRGPAACWPRWRS